MTPAHAGRPRHVGKHGFGGPRVSVLVEPARILPRKVPKGTVLLPRQRQEPHPASRESFLRQRQIRQRLRHGYGLRRARWQGGLAGCFIPFHHHVGVRPRYPEGADRGPRRPVGTKRPVRVLGSHPHREPLPVEVRVRVLEVQLPRNQPPLHRQHRLNQARNSGGRLQMPDIGLHRADQQGTVLFASPAVDRRGGLHLDRVPQRGSGPVCLQVVHFSGRNSRPRQRLLDHPLLRRTIRHGRACGRPVLVDG